MARGSLWRAGLGLLGERKNMNEGLHRFNAAVVERTIDNLPFAAKHPRAFAFELRERGLYRKSTFIGDIERSVRSIVRIVVARNEP